MARSIATIKQEIIEAKNNDSILSGKLSSTSQTAIWNLWAYITAVAINLHEQLLDISRKEIETIAANVVPGTPIWLRQKVLEFQYKQGEAQVLKLINFVPKYEKEDTSLRLIAQCSIRQQSDRFLLIKVAKMTDKLGPLGNEGDSLDDNSEINALKSYIKDIKFAGTAVRVVSFFPDRLQVYAEIFYNGQYVKKDVKDNVILAITNYLKSIPFDGVVSNTKLVDAIQLVPGVVDIKLNQVVARISTDAPDKGVNVPLTYQTYAGYIIPEDNIPELDPFVDLSLDKTLTMTLASTN